ncbi:hypothetical protein LTR53_016396 [Teratosphaeriaceae sp. CCFEE 6253]|nr:hypothetical protein LTR53_016396 [Teratosphaeriaceae sp. CCFEE 6253]
MEPQYPYANLSGASAQSDDNSPPSAGTNNKRQRAKQACEPCRLRKRKCDGAKPCNMCTQFEYKCYFEKHPRKRSKLVQQNEALHDGVAVVPADPVAPGLLRREGTVTEPEPAKEDRTGIEDATKMRSMEANSGIAFTRLLGLRLDPSSGPKLFTFGWNLGRSTYSVATTPAITDFLALDQMHALGRLYFAHVHPLYGFLDEAWTIDQINWRWANPEACRAPDHILAGIAALGILWSDGSLNGVLPQIVDLAKLALEGTSIMQPPCLIDVTSWVLRVLYLRLTDHPHATWMATCTAMHLVESTGIHQEQSFSTLHPHANDHLNDTELRRRTFWVARMLNTWISFEVALRGITCLLPTARDKHDFTTDYIGLYSISCCLDPDRTNQAGQWEEFITQLEAYEVRHDGIMLSKANLALCGYRRIRLANPALLNDVTNRIINIGLSGLEAARRFANQGMPWWHVANVPFQCVCVFLAMDTRESLAQVATAMRALEYVVDKFKTVAMKEALKTARFLVRLSKKRKDEDSSVLGGSLKKLTDCMDRDPDPEYLAQQHRSSIVGQVNGGPMIPAPVNNMTANGTPRTASSEDWNMDILNNSDFDWNYFLTADLPAFQSFAPDGTM